MLQASLAGGGEEMQSRLGEMSRKLTLLLVNEKVLVRKLKLLQELEAGLRKVMSPVDGCYVRISTCFAGELTAAA